MSININNTCTQYGCTKPRSNDPNLDKCHVECAGIRLEPPATVAGSACKVCNLKEKEAAYLNSPFCSRNCASKVNNK